MKPQIARTNSWSIPVLVDEDGNMFYQVLPQVKLAVITNQNIELIDCPDLHGVTSKLKLTEMKLAKLEKQVKEGYSAEYLSKYFSETVCEIPDLMVTQKIVVAYGKFLDEMVLGSGKIHDKNQELNRNTEMSNIDKDLLRIKWFHEYLETKEK